MVILDVHLEFFVPPEMLHRECFEIVARSVAAFQ
jgi:hypothetical protein